MSLLRESDTLEAYFERNLLPYAEESIRIVVCLYVLYARMCMYMVKRKLVLTIMGRVNQM